MEDRIVCHCMEVSYETIKKAIEDGAKNSRRYKRND